MNGNLDLFCLDCGEFVQWRRVRLYRADSYPDWRLEVFCRCGSETDERVLARARAAYDLAVGAELDNLHQDYFNSMLTRSGNLYFETLAGTGSGRRRSDPCRSFFEMSDRSDLPAVFVAGLTDPSDSSNIRE